MCACELNQEYESPLFRREEILKRVKKSVARARAVNESDLDRTMDDNGMELSMLC